MVWTGMISCCRQCLRTSTGGPGRLQSLHPWTKSKASGHGPGELEQRGWIRWPLEVPSKCWFYKVFSWIFSSVSAILSLQADLKPFHSSAQMEMLQKERIKLVSHHQERKECTGNHTGMWYPIQRAGRINDIERVNVD